jgi:pyridoxine 5-phosphate synthase
MSIRLHINIDHIATLRNARGTTYPDPVHAAFVCERAGADGITVHLREDRRHIVDRDVHRLRESVTTLLNLEMAASQAMVEVALEIVPDAVTMVPERREERTTEGGLDVVSRTEEIARICARMIERGIKPSLFIAPEAAQVDASRRAGALQIELHTGEYCNATSARRTTELERLRSSARRAHDLGLEVAAGHGLTRANVIDVAAIPEVVELNIGHAVVADAMFGGLQAAVRSFREAIARGLARR